MRPSIGSNVGQVLARMRARKAAVERELTKVAPKIAREVNGVSKYVLQTQIYDIPIPLTASANRKIDLAKIPEPLRRYVLYADQHGPAVTRIKFRNPLSATSKVRSSVTKGKHGKWSRSGKLKRSESARTRGPVVYLVNDADYAAARYMLGQPGHARAGIQRSQEKVPEAERSQTRPVQWQKVAVQRSRPWILEQRREALFRALAHP